MSIREQMRSILRGEGSESLPFAPRLDLWYAAKRWTNSLPAPYQQASLEEICRREGWGIYRLTPDFRDLYDRKGDWPWTALGIFRAAETLYEISLTDQVQMTVRDHGRGMHVTFDTPLGPLTAELVRVGAPLYFKFEPGHREAEIYKEWTDVEYQNFLCREKIKQAQCTIEWIERFDPDLKLSAPGPDDLVLCQP